MLEDPNLDGPPYIGPLVNMSLISQIQRGNYTWDLETFSLYEPPNLELYILLSKKVYFFIFFGCHLIQIVTIYFVKYLLHKSTPTTISMWENFLCSVEQSHFPFPYDDWDAENGGCLDHIKRKKASQIEFLSITIINLLFNMILLFPLVILCKTCYFKYFSKYFFYTSSFLQIIQLERGIIYWKHPLLESWTWR